jgi:hypothetical protein
LANEGGLNQSPGLPGPTDQIGSVGGVVQDKDGTVYEGVRVVLTQSAAIKLPERAVTTDANGRFLFTAVPAGAFTLTISSTGFATQTISGSLHPGEVYEAANIVLPFANSSTDVHVTASQVEIAEEQVHQEEQQRVLGIVPNFYVSYVPNAAPLTVKQKFHLAWRSSIDPVSFLASGFFAGVQQAEDDFRGYGQGSEGYAKRFGANYADEVIGIYVGSAILPSIFKQDPRYFYKGTGTIRSRVLYAIANSVICKGDNGHWQFNYSAVIGGLAAGGISNIYYPASDRNGVSLTFENALLGTAGGAVGNIVEEFFIKRLTPHVPNYGSMNPPSGTAKATPAPASDSLPDPGPRNPGP